MTEHEARLLEALLEAGKVEELEGLSGPRKQEVRKLHELAVRKPARAAVKLLDLKAQLKHAQKQCERAAQAAQKLEELLEQLLASDTALCPLVSVQANDGMPARAVVRYQGALRSFRIHPDVDAGQLSRLLPWEYVCIHTDEMVVVGTYSDPALFGHAHGEVVEFRAYHDQALGLARIQRQGDDEAIVQLSPALREPRLERGARLILSRFDESWAIAELSTDQVRSRFEFPISQIETRLEDLGGLEEVLEPLLEDLLLRLVFTEDREQFDLRPLSGMLLSSRKPGMGKTALVRAVAAWLEELGEQHDFDVVLYVVKPNELKSHWHGGDARLVRDELCGMLRARQQQPRARRLFQLVVLDEVDSLGKRAGGNDGSVQSSAAHNDVVTSLLAEMDGIQQPATAQRAAAHVLWMGLTNRPDLLDDALKRPGRFGDLVLEMPDITREAAEDILAIYARNEQLPWCIGGDVRAGVPGEEIRERFLRPSLAQVYSLPVLRLVTDRQHEGTIDVTAGEVLAGVHYMQAMNEAKRRAARRKRFGSGVPAITLDDVLEGLLEQALTAAGQLHADHAMLRRQLRIDTPINRVELVPRDELVTHPYVRPLSA